ncbi:MAG: M28 family peptidase [Anaerolineales bacterium]|nr:M28 family peptidase [Anaerolineales bacterium]
MTKKSIAIYLIGIGLLLAVVLAWYANAFLIETEPEYFNGERALADVETQVAFGPRTPGSAGHAQILDWMRAELSAAGWDSRIQSAEMLGHPIQNVIAYRGEEMPKIILAAHYDTRMHADNDPDPMKILEPVPGANDGASGVAVLLELARVLPEDTVPVWLVFFDAEDNGRIQGWDWILGSQAFVAELETHPEAVIIVDMIGDADLNIYIEQNSDQRLAADIWAVAATLGYGQVFIPEPKYSMIDDHTPFLQAGIPAIDIIDFDYPYWHTTQDTVDKVSAESLEIVGTTLQEWIAHRSSTP